MSESLLSKYCLYVVTPETIKDNEGSAALEPPTVAVIEQLESAVLLVFCAFIEILPALLEATQLIALPLFINIDVDASYSKFAFDFNPIDDCVPELDTNTG